MHPRYASGSSPRSLMADRLRPFGHGLWVADGPVVDFYSFPYPTRTAIARLSDGSLWIWSPIHLDPQLRDEVEALGQPAHLVSPNKIHHLFLGEWKGAYPSGKLWGLPAVARKRRDRAFAGELGALPPGEWERDIDQVVFRGSLLMDEVVFFHRSSRRHAGHLFCRTKGSWLIGPVCLFKT